MIPLRDENPTRRVPVVTVAFIIVNVLVFLFEATRTDAELVAFINRWGAQPDALAANPLDFTLWPTVLTSMFLHGGWLHLGGNMLYLWIFGNNVEDRFGHIAFVLFYVLSGVAAVAAHILSAPGSTTPLVGASGAIAGVLGAYALLYPQAKVLTLIPIIIVFEIAVVPAVFVIGFWFVLQLLQGLGSLGQEIGGGVAWWAHVGGFVFGLLVALAARAFSRGGGRSASSGYRTWS